MHEFLTTAMGFTLGMLFAFWLIVIFYQDEIIKLLKWKKIILNSRGRKCNAHCKCKHAEIAHLPTDYLWQSSKTKVRRKSR